VVRASGLDPMKEENATVYTIFTYLYHALLGTNADFGEKIQRALYPLHRSDSAYLTTLLYEELPPKPK
jgi:hypothetical protein